MMLRKPELLAPAGNLEKLKIAYHYGADAAYIGGTVFGLRKYAENFTLKQLELASALAQEKNKKLYVVLNGFAHDTDLQDIEQYLVEIEHIPIDAFIISDLGVAKLAQKHPTAEIHVSTQASITNAYGCMYWADHGATRVVLAREVTLEQCEDIRRHTPIELELFVHGAMCASYSGKCVISNYTVGRDSNRGGCVQSCRHVYSLADAQGTTQDSQIMNAKDLQAIRTLPQLMKLGIESIKVEGRMKSQLYVANTIKTYRRCIDALYPLLAQKQPLPDDFFAPFETQLQYVSHRGFSTGGLEHRPYRDSIGYDFGGYHKEVDFVGLVKATTPTHALIEVRNTFTSSDTLALLKSDGAYYALHNMALSSLDGETLCAGRPNMMMQLQTTTPFSELDIVVKLEPHTALTLF